MGAYVCEYLVPTELTEYTEAYGLKLLESRAYRRCASYDRRPRIDCLCSVAEVKHGLLPMAAQAFISVDSCIAKRRPFCGFEKLRPVGFCVVCAFCGDYIQKNYK